MTILEEIVIQRRKFLDGLDANEGEINLDIFEDFYPDKAHFIFELLQNAEDAEASEAIFTLTQEYCAFEHNGKRRFTEQDVRAITGINNSTKSKDPDQIGKFGVGFKSVFVYSLTPHVYSGEFSFQIRGYVLPEPMDNDPNLGDITRFVLPFNNPKKPSQVAYEEIKVGLEELAETNLLFLSNLASIRWQFDQQPAGKVMRIEHPDYHIEVQKQTIGKTTTSSHFMRFSEIVEGLENQRVSIAFKLGFLNIISVFDPEKPLADQLKIIPANPGKVAVFFPAEKETSGLRFHLHAPFVPELSRASIKETPLNQPLFNQLARLTASSLYTVRDLKLLTGDFLGVLPNPKDDIPIRYQPICEAIIMEMNDNPLTPTQTNKHEPARRLLQAKASLKALLSEEDIEFLVDYDEEPFKWAIGAQQKNSNVDHFLSNLDIQEWDVEVFVQMLEENASETSRLYNFKHESITDAEVMAWFAKKSDEWHQELYALLSSEYLIGQDYKQSQAIKRLKLLRIVRLSNGSYNNKDHKDGYRIGRKCYFPSDKTEHDKLLPRVAKGVYSSGKSKMQQEAARKLLEKIGVREVGEAEQVEGILKQRYTAESFNPNINDLKRFISLVEKEPQQVKLFTDYYIFKRKNGKWGTPSQVFLDDPFMATGLSAYYDALGEKATRVALAESYKNCGISLKELAKFANSVGAKARLEIELVSCIFNSDVQRLVHQAPGKWSSLHINKDYMIKYLKDIIDKHDKALSSLIWNTLCRYANPNWITAQYRNNASCDIRSAPSQLICILRDAKWVPQKGGTFVRPCNASPELLLEGFSFDSGQAWLKAVDFGGKILQRSEEQRKKQVIARELGFPDKKSLEDAKWFVGLTEEERQQFKAEHQNRNAFELSEHESVNPERRNQRVGEQAVDAPERQTEPRTRSVSVGLEEVKKDAKPYLRKQYTNRDGQMICQVCKTLLPFKLDDGNDYFETVEFIPELNMRHYQNYLALCPNHKAMFMYANGSSNLLKDMFLKIEINELEVVLAQKETTIYFTKNHIADLKAVIKVDQLENEPDVQS